MTNFILGSRSGGVNFSLQAGSEIDLLANGVFVKALYPIYNASGDNWFVGEAGNTSVSGANNLVGGVGAFTALSSGSGNTIFGAGAGSTLTGASANNTLLGRWTGPAGAVSNVIALSDGAGNLIWDYNYTASSKITPAVQVRSTVAESFVSDLGGSSGSNGFAVYNGGSLLGYIRGDGTVAGTQVGTGDNATAALSQSTAPIGVKLYSGGSVNWSNSTHWWDTTDTGISRKAAGVIAFGDGTSGDTTATFAAKTKAGAVVAADLASGSWAVIRDTTNLTTKLYYNNAGTLMSVALV